LYPAMGIRVEFAQPMTGPNIRNRSLPWAAAAVLGLALPALAEGRQNVPSGRELYLSACAACHGPEGKGMPRSIVGFETPLPDLTDCSFATPEADADWFAVAHSGGRVRAFDRRMPAFGEALSQDELASIIRHIRGFCTDKAWPRGELNMPRPLVTEKAFPENEAVLTTGIEREGHSSINSSVVYERRFGARNQFEAVIPFGFQESSGNRWDMGLGDIVLALKRVVYHRLERGSIVSIAGELIVPTGDHDDRIGSGVMKFEPYLAVGQLLSPDSFVQFQGGFELSSRRPRVEHEAFWRAAIGRTLFEPNFGRAWTPMLELLGSRELSSGSIAHWDVVPQVQVSLSRRQHVLLNIGVQMSLNDRRDRGTRVLTYLLWDWFDGGFFSGWR
jgi:mono/diheme cytochrome c family protein